jgi:hypothetical protein
MISIQDCIHFVECNITTEGLFRIPGSKQKIDLAIYRYILNCPVDFSTGGGVHCACSILKLLFRELEVNLFESGTVISNSDPLQLVKIAALRLQPNEFNMFRDLFLLLHKVDSYSDINLMTAKNLSIIWGPNFFKDDYLKHATLYTELIEKMIVESANIFV